MGDADLFAKLNRILETHNLSNGEEDDDFLERFSYDIGVGNSFANKSDLNLSGSGKPTPYEVWKSKQVDNSKKKPTPKLSSQEWDGLVNHLHRTNKLKESSVMKEQNEGLAAEFSGHQFKPTMNKRSQELMQAKRGPLHLRTQGIVAEHEEKLSRKREDKKLKEIEECTFKPSRQGEATSDKYLKKLGRQSNSKGSVDPEYFFKYHEEKLRRNAIRYQIAQEMTSRELTFTPTLNSKSQVITDKLKRAQLITEKSVMSTPGKSKHLLSGETPKGTPLGTPRTPRGVNRTQPFSSLSKLSTQKILEVPNKLMGEAGMGDPTAGDYIGAPVVVESSHPYKHNANEYTIVHIHGAISYSITFDERTRTEGIHDYVKFYTDDRHTEYYGCGKYSGGMQIQANPKFATKDEEANPRYSSSNWCGLGGRPPLVIPASRFVVCFRSNGTVNDWGFRLYATPLISGSVANVHKDAREGHPSISNRGKLFGSVNRGSFSGSDSFHDTSISSAGQSGSVFDRLHYEAVKRSTALHNQQAELVKSKLNISTKPWEESRVVNADGNVVSSKNAWTQQKTHVAKGGHNTDISPLLTKSSKDGRREPGDRHKSSYCVIEFEDSVNSLWKSLRVAQPNPNFVRPEQPNDGDYGDDEEQNPATEGIPEL